VDQMKSSGTHHHVLTLELPISLPEETQLVANIQISMSIFMTTGMDKSFLYLKNIFLTEFKFYLSKLQLTTKLTKEWNSLEDQVALQRKNSISFLEQEWEKWLEKDKLNQKDSWAQPVGKFFVNIIKVFRENKDSS
jgi:hypothetical protein